MSPLSLLRPLHLAAALGVTLAHVCLPWALSAQDTLTLPPQDRPLRVASEPVLTVGGMDAPDWAAFDRVDQLAFGPGGNLNVLDERNDRVVVVGADGALLRVLGRSGGGPGEFQVPRHMVALRSGGLVVYDVIQRRFSIFDAEGAFERSVSGLLGEGPPGALHATPDGVSGPVQVMVLNGEPVARSASGMRPVRGRPLQRYELEGDGRAHVLHRSPLELKPADAQGRPYLTAFFPEFQSTGLPDGTLAVVEDGSYAITLVRPTGGVAAVLRRPLPRRMVTEGDRSRERERLVAALAQGRPPEATVSFGTPPSREEMERRHRARIEEMRFPDTFAQISELRADAEGRLWVERTGEDPHGPGPIDILLPSGRYLGTLPAGEPGMPMAFGPGGLAAWVDLDALDVPTIRVERLRLLPPAPAR